MTIDTGEAKPIYEAVRDMDTEREPARVAKARAHIGEDLFEYLLNPPEIAEGNDSAKMFDFGTS